jgi:hypothetical protein
VTHRTDPAIAGPAKFLHNCSIAAKPISRQERKEVAIMVRISSREWTLAQIKHLSVLIAAGSTAANAALVLRRSVVVVQAKARNLRTPFKIGGG